MSDERVKIWREANTSLYKQNLMPTFKHGVLSAMVWGCVSASGIENLHFIDGIMNAKKYMDILTRNLHQRAKNWV